MYPCMQEELFVAVTAQDRGFDEPEHLGARLGQGPLDLAGGSFVERGVDDHSPTPRRFDAPDLELGLDESDDGPTRFDEFDEPASNHGERDEREIDHQHGEGSTDRRHVDRADVGALDHRHPRVVPDARVELTVPDVEGDGGDFSIKAKDGNLKFGYGARVGLLDESIITPGVYASYLQRDLPTVTLSGASGGSGAGSGTFALNDFSVKTTAMRLVAQKSLLIFGLTAGVGQDTYKASANISANVSGASATGAADMSMTRTNMFVGASFNLFILKVAAEYGQVSGGSVAAPYNTFDKSPDASHKYGSLGIRLAF